jgi:hypothetical protein
MKIYSFLLLLIGGFSNTAFAQLSTNLSTGYFNTNSGYEVGYELDGQPNYPNGGWQSNDGYNPGPPPTGARSVVQFFNFYTLGTPQQGNNSVLFGGYANTVRTPGITNPSLYYNFTPTTTSTSDVVNITVDFALYRPSPEFTTNRDTFGFTLWNSFDSSELAKFELNPNATWLTNDASYGFSWFRDGVSQTNNPALLSPTWIFGASAIYRLELAISDTSFDAEVKALSIQTNGIGAVTNYTTSQTLQLISGGELASGFTVEDFGAISLDWSLESGDPADPGERYMVVNQVSITTVPEPSTLFLVLLASAFFLAVRKLQKSS